MTQLDPVLFVHARLWHSAPDKVRAQLKLSLLDLLGIAAAAQPMRPTAIIADHAADQFPGPLPMLLDGRGASAAGFALAAGMRIDALDGHDGFNPAKGHIGCPLLPAALATATETQASGADFLETLLMGYEFGARASIAQHATAPDYHTSGSWGAVTAAAAVARLTGQDRDTTRHALGIAEYHGPRSQMMRCIDFPTMVKDGSGWGSMAGVSAAKLAAAGFTGAPALVVEDAPAHWADLTQRWYMLEQYYKPYPVCRWAQAPIEAALTLRRAHGLTAGTIAGVEIESFHESVRLATAEPRGSDAAQYSTSFPVAVALMHGDVRAEHLDGAALSDPETLRLSRATTMREDAAANAAFPQQRLARVTLTLADGRSLTSDWHEPRWDHTAPPTSDELRAKFHAMAAPVLGTTRTDAIEQVIDTLEGRPLSDLTDLILSPPAGLA